MRTERRGDTGLGRGIGDAELAQARDGDFTTAKRERPRSASAPPAGRVYTKPRLTLGEVAESAEGSRLLSGYRGKTSVPGSNPGLSAIQFSALGWTGRRTTKQTQFGSLSSWELDVRGATGRAATAFSST